jgi:hypothetical protein
MAKVFYQFLGPRREISLPNQAIVQKTAKAEFQSGVAFGSRHFCASLIAS